MGTRKKARLDAQADNNQNGSVNNTNSDGANTPSSSTTAVDATETPPSQSEAAQGGNAPQNISQEDEVDEPRTASSKSGRWYSSSWKSKAPAMTRVNTESVASPEQRKAESSDNSKQVVPTSPRRYMTSEGRRSSKSLPLAASTTILNVTSNKASDSRTQEGREDGDIKMKEPPLPPDPIKTHDGKVEGGKIDKDQPDKASKEPPKAAVSTWRGWWSKPDPGTVEEATEKSKSEELDNAREDAKQIPLPESPDVTRKSDPMAIAGRVEVPAPAPADGLDTKDGAVEGATSASQNRSSWFAFWSKAENAKSDPPPDEHHNQEPAPVTDTQSDSGPAVKVTPASEPATPSEDKDHAREVPQKSSGWAFWSREKPKSDAASDTESTHKQVGEIAVADTPSQSNPEAAQFNEHKDTAEKKPKKEHPKPLKRGRGLLKGSGSVSVSAPVTPTKGTPSGSPTRISTETLSTQPEAQPPTLSQAQKKPALQAKAAAIKEPRPKNILIPEFQSTYQLTQTPTYWEQLRRFFLGTGQEAPRVCIEPSPPRIRRALAIGVHGFFPAATFRFVLGQPTGTSIRFANFAAQAIKEWVEQHGNYDCEIEKVALEGEGFIADRVDTLWKLLLNWFDQIRRADFILVAAHSQGVPVAVMLVAKLIQFGCIGANARIGICAMAGVNMGPFIEYKTSLFGSTANELFEFTKPDSKVSLMYEEALDVILGHGVRITFVGSIDDQLVSIESSTFTPLTHPYIYRAVFVSSLPGVQPKPDFIAALVGFALKLRNLGVSDHGLIRELSPALAGSLVSGDGHSRVYDDLSVYALAVRCALETTTLPIRENPKVERSGGTASSFSSHPRRPNEEKSKGKDGKEEALSATGTTASSNPFFLPWAMRGVLEEELVRKELGDECRELLALFEEWRPVSKQLKDVRFRLEAVRSKL